MSKDTFNSAPMLTLHHYQKAHANHLADCIRQSRSAIDASDPGSGKTYVASSIAAELRVPVVIITTKATVPNWSSVAAGFGVTPILVTNYEKIRLGKQAICRRSGNRYIWNVPENTLLIFDECQKCKGRTSLNGKLLIAARSQHLRILLCSATAASNPLEMRAIGYALGLHNISDFWSWAIRYGVRETAFGMKFTGDESYLKSLHERIFPAKGSRLRIADIPDFPETSIESVVLETGKAKTIQRIYDGMRRELKQATKAEDKAALKNLAERMDARKASAMTIVLRARQAIELHKVPAMVELAKDGIEEGMGVVLLVNFTETIKALSEQLDCPHIIQGNQTPEERQRIIEQFQRNEIPLVIANIQAGGVGVSLHDPSGQRPRLSIISPTFSAQDLRQALGRVHRSGGAASIQKICFAAGTCEETTARTCATKLANIDLLNDGDMQPFPISSL